MKKIKFLLSRSSKAKDIKSFGGGKSIGLYQLQQYKINVPKWFCLDSRFFDEKISSIKPKIQIILRESTSPESFNEIQSIIKSIPFSNSEKEELNSLFNSPIAVRSSANAEDGIKSSFAGIFDTFLFVENDIATKIKECWASLFTQQHHAYLQTNKIDIFSIKMAVVLQEMIDSEKSGIFFQAHPNGNINQQLLVSGYGLGQGIVDGDTPTDLYTINSITKEIKSENNTKGTQKIFCHRSKKVIDSPIGQKKRNSPSLSQKEIIFLKTQVEKIRSETALFHDIEWTYKDHKFYFLQARPITTVSQDRNIIFYDNSNIVENYPNITLPFTSSNLKRLYGVNFEYLLIRVGVDNKTLDKIRPYLYQLTETFEGRVYYQVNNWYKILELIPFISTKVKKSWDQMIGIQNTQNNTQNSINKIKVNHFTIAKRVLPSFYQAFINVEKQKDIYQKHFSSFYKHYQDIDLNQYTKMELVEVYQDAEIDFFGFTNYALFNDLMTSIHLSICKFLLKNDLDKLVELTQNDHNLESFKLVLSAQGLVESIRRKQELKKIIKDAISAQQLKLIQIFDPHFFSQLTKHLELYGDRSMEEMKFEVPTTRELPYEFLKSLVSMSELPKTAPTAPLPIKKIIKNPIKRMLLTPFLNRYKSALSFRELSRLNRARMKGLMRKFLLCLGQKLVDQGRLNTPSDIFYVGENHLIQNLMGTKTFHNTVKKSVKFLSTNKDKLFPAQFILNDTVFDPDWFTTSETIINTDTIFQGTGCHGKELNGEILIVDTPSMDLDVSGKIIVTLSTDPGWVFLMMRAKALIVERGNLLSHAAIIGREIGIPTIIGVPGITQKLKSGDKVSMNGKSGVIKKI
jgi:phosphohistidine swiveling domain-containing protein